MQEDEGPLHGDVPGSSISPARPLSCDTGESPDVIAWTAGRTMNRRHVLVGHVLPVRPLQLPLLDHKYDGVLVSTS